MVFGTETIGQSITGQQSQVTAQPTVDQQLANRAQEITRLSPSSQQAINQQVVDQVAKSTEDKMWQQNSYDYIAKPQLTPPTSDHTTIPFGALLIVLFSAVAQGDQLQLKNKAFSDDLYFTQKQKALDACDQAITELEDELDIAGARLTDLQQQDSLLQEQLDQAEDQLSHLDPGTPEYQAALQKRDELKMKFGSTHDQLQAAQQKKEQLEASLSATQAQARALNANYQALDAVSNSTTAKQNGKNDYSLSDLVMIMRVVIFNSDSRYFQGEANLAKAEGEALTHGLQDDVKEEADQAKKAEQMHKLGCIAKIIGAIITVISVVSSIFTAGASLAAEVTVKRLVKAAVKLVKVAVRMVVTAGIMKGVQEAVKKITPLIVNALKEKGLDSKAAEILSILISIAIVIVGMMVAFYAGNQFAKLTSKLLDKVFANTIEKYGAKEIESLSKAAGKLTEWSNKRAKSWHNIPSEEVVSGPMQSMLNQQMYQALKMWIGMSTRVFSAGANITADGLQLGADQYNVNAAEAGKKIGIKQATMEALNSVQRDLVDFLNNSLNLSNDLAKIAFDFKALEINTATQGAVALSGHRAA